MTYNHDNFMEQLLAVSSEKKQLDLLKSYMLQLPMQEFDSFLFGNLDKLEVGLKDLLTSKDLKKSDKKDLNLHIDTIVDLLQTMKHDVSIEKRKAA
jgi:hypothetical protein